jgi:glucose dehydrogenase
MSPGLWLRWRAAMDLYLHAFDIETGKELWKYQLPAGGQATPMSYTFKGKQYVVIAAGGHGKLGTKQGDYVLAFALPWCALRRFTATTARMLTTAVAIR